MTHPHYSWTFDPAQLIVIGLFAWIYIRRFMQARREAGGRGAGWPQLTAFTAAIFVILVALVSPVDSLGEDYLFSIHMVQHILLGDIAPLLVLLSL